MQVCSLSLLLLLGATSQGEVAGTAPCSSPPARAFDFWIGEWRIAQQILAEDGGWLSLDARTSVRPALDGCALIEHWAGDVQFFWEGMHEPVPIKAISVRAYDPETGQWYIHWMDTRTPKFNGAYIGNFEAGRGTFFRDWETPDGPRRGRILFHDIKSDSLEWELAISSDNGKSWTTLWKMDMQRD